VIRWFLHPFRLIVLLAIVWFIAMYYLLLHPKTDHPTQADVVMVLSGDSKHRMPTALQMEKERVAPVLVISDGANGIPRAQSLCATGGIPAYRVVCFRPNPYSTRGEAEMFARLAAKNHWHSVAIVSSPTHITRLRILFKRCFKGKIYAVKSKQSRVSKIQSVFSETAKLIYEETLVRSC
jgi:uncharacterized SAM-binding protein YcdF (DUF218 family)